MYIFKSNFSNYSRCTIGVFAVLCCLVFTNNSIQAQDIGYQAFIDLTRSFEGPVLTGDCWENGDEEYTVDARIWDNITGSGGQTNSLNRQCTANGNCTQNANGPTRSLTNDPTTLFWRVRGWEDDSAPRSTFNGDDDCLGDRTCNINITGLVDNVWRNNTCNVGSDHEAVMRWRAFYVSVNQPSAFTHTGSVCGQDFLNAISSNQNHVTWYWQGTNSNGTSTANPSTSNFNVNANGTYYLRARGDRNGVWSSSRSLNVTLSVDNSNPSISCSSNVTVNTATGTCISNVSLSNPTTSDNCGISDVTSNTSINGVRFIRLTQNLNQFINLAEFQVFQGATNIAAGATVTQNAAAHTAGPNTNFTDGNLNNFVHSATSSAGNWVQVDLGSAQNIDYITVHNRSDCCQSRSANFTLEYRDASNNVIATNTSFDVYEGVNSAHSVDNHAGTFTLGSNTVVWSAVDLSGNTSTCNQTVTVIDNENPTISCPASITTTTNTACTATGVALGNASAADNCSVSTSNNAPAAFALGTTTVIWTATDGSNNTATCNQTVTVTDDDAPIAACQNYTAQLDASSNVTITAANIDNGSSDNCSVSLAITNGQVSFNCDDLGTTETLTLTATDMAGNSATCTAVVTIADDTNPCNEPPVAVCQDVTVNTDANCQGTVTLAQVDNGSSDPDNNITSITLSPTGPYSLGTTPVTLTVMDAEGETSTCSATITVNDDDDPTISCPADVSVSTDNGACSATGVALGSATAADNCPGESVSNDALASYPIGITTVTYTVTDAAGNSASCLQTVTVTDDEDPTITCNADVTQDTDAGSCDAVVTYSITGADNCPGELISQTAGIASGSTFPLGTTTNTFVIVDAAGNTATCSFDVTIVDNEAPTAICQGATVILDASGAGDIREIDIDNGSNDACGITSLALSQEDFDCSHVGVNTVTLTVTDNNGNVSTCTATVTVEDNTNPVAICQDITVVLDAVGDYTLNPALINNGSTDACGIATLSVSTTTFNCDSIGSNLVTLTVTDANGNSSSCESVVTVDDNVNPIALCQDITIQLDPSGIGEIESTDIDGGSSDECGIEALSLSQFDYDCSHVGSNIVTLTVLDNNSNEATCTATVTVEDNVVPNAVCSDITVQLDAAGTVSITTGDIDNASSDACGIAALAINNTDFDCGDIGPNTVTLTVTDVNGNTSACTSIVTVQDNVAPVATCQDITVQLDATGAGSITTGDIDNGSTDACGIASLSLDRTSFGCANVGANTVTLTVTDNNGNASTCSSIVTVQDNVAPVATCQDVTIQLDATGAGSITTGDIDNGSTDACGIASLSLDNTNFACADVGSNTITLTVTDNNGNVSTCTAAVTVQDNVAPEATCQDVTVQLDAIGVGSITTGDVDNGSSDACGIASLALDDTNFGCANVGANTVTLTVTDNNGNVSSCTSAVTVQDNVAPEATCQDVTVQLDATGAGSITTGDIDNGSTDACGIVSLSLDNTNFACADVGSNAITLTVTDNNGNASTCAATVTVEDNVAPVATCQDATIQLDASGTATIGVSNVNNGSSDACGIASLVLDETAFDCSSVGGNTVTLTVTDNNSNVSSCTSTITIEDNVVPVALCQSITVQLDAAGAAGITTGDIDNGSTDACGIASLSLDNTNFACSDVGVNTVTLTVTDNNGNTSTCTATVTVEDNVAPVAICQDLTVQLDAAGSGSIGTGDIDNGSNDACGIASLSLDNTSFDCSNIGANIVTLTVTDNNGNATTCTSTVTVEDNVDAVAVCKDITIQLDAAGDASITTADIDNGSGDACGIASLVLDNTDFACADVGTNTITLTVTDNNGNISTCTSTVTVEDNVAPVATCQNITVQLNATGNASITTGDIDNGSNDACGLASVVLDQTSFICSSVGANTVSLTATDNNGNASTCTATVTVEDNVAPVAICQDITVQLNSSGTANIATGDIDNGSNDACGIAALALDNTSFACANVGANTITLTVTDNNGNVSTCTSSVTVEDNVAPVALCQNITLQLDAAGAGSITTGDIDNGSSDACGIAALVLDNTNFACANVGANTVTLTVTDNNGNVSTCTSTVTVEDNVAPVATCQDLVVQLDATGVASITTGDIDNGSSDACGIASLVLDDTDFVCTEVGVNTITLTVTDNNGNVSTCTSAVTIEDNVAPVATCQDVTVQLSSGGGTASITTGDINNGSSDACGIASLVLDETDFTCSDEGANTVTLTVTDNNGNASTCTAIVTVEDNIAPIATCQNITVQLDAAGVGTITTADIDNGSSDACGIASLVLDDSDFACADVGANTVTLTVTDNNGNVSTCSAMVTVEDNVAPVATCQDVSVQLDAAGAASITTGDVDNGSNDACGIASLSLDETDFTCADVGANTVTLTVTDNNGNVSNCIATITVEDSEAPAAVCQNVTVQLDASGSASITTGDIDNGSSDNCGIASLNLDNTSFDCSNIGANTVTLTVTDNNGNATTCTATVTVEDNVAPVATCQDITVQLDAAGGASIVAADVDNGSADACGTLTLAIDISSFDCSAVGANTVTLTVTDPNGNTTSCASIVTVEDNVAPIATCQNATVQLDASGAGSLTTGDIDNGSNDACGIASLALDNSDFNCADVGTNTVTLTVTDNNGNASTCTATVTVEDNVAPVATCQDVTVQLDAAGAGSITTGDIDNGSSDACGIASLSLDDTDFACVDVGTNTVTLTVTDNNGNVATCTAIITVEDNVAPVAICQDVTVQLDAAGAGAITTGDIDDGSNDACGIASLVLDDTDFACADVGGNTVTLTVTDNNGNVATCSATVIVEDNVAPVATCQDVTVQLDALGAGSITTGDIDNGSNDACGIANLSLDDTGFGCADVGGNTVTLTVTDNNGNVATCSAIVTVEDNVAPAAACQDVTIELDINGNAAVTTGDIDNGSSDACGIASLALDNMDFDCSSVGSNTVTMTVTDNNGNISTCTAVVTVEDNISPTAICQDLTVQLDANGMVSITAENIDNGSFDNCDGSGSTNNALPWINEVNHIENGMDADNSVEIIYDGSLDLNAYSVKLYIGSFDGSLDVYSTMTLAQIDGNATSLGNGLKLAVIPATISLSQLSNDRANGWGVFSGSTPIEIISWVGVQPGSVVTNDGFTATHDVMFAIGENDVNSNRMAGYTIVAERCGTGTPSAVTSWTSVLNKPSNVGPNNHSLGSVNACQTLTSNGGGSGNGLTLTIDQSDFNCNNVGINTVTLTVSDPSGNSSSCVGVVTVEDNIAPVAICQDVTVQLDAAGAGSITTGDIDNGSSDACGIASLALDDESFACADVGGNTVTLTVTDNNGNVSTCSATVTVADNIAPVAICQDVTVQLDALGAGSITTGDIDNGSNDACGIASLSLDDTAFGCADVGVNTVTLTVTDNNGNVSSCTSMVTIEDNINPGAMCQDITVQLDVTGNASIAVLDVDNGSGDACGNQSLVLDITTFDCSNVGANTVTLTVTDNNNNSSTCTAIVTVEDNIAPVATCQDVTIQLDAAGAVSITTADIDDGSSDACGIASLSLDDADFVCADVGENTVTLTVTDNNGNVTTCTATVTVEDNVAPVALCQDLTVQLDASGNGSITTADVDNGSNDACAIASLSIDVSTFDCSNVGTNPVVLTVVDNNGNISTCTSAITIEDNVAPVANCQDATVQLDVTGNGSIVIADIDDGSADACGDNISLSLDNTSFDCLNVGTNIVTLSVTDDNGNISSCTATVTVEDNVAPVAICQDVTVQLDAAGAGSITTGDIDNGSSDACGVASLSLDNTSFDCGDIDINTVTLTVTDNNGNISSCTATVTVEDNVAPVASCQDVTVQLNASGTGSITTGDVDNGSNDACEIASLALNNTAYDCSNVGANSVTLTVTDNNGNVSTCSAVITVEDGVAPTANCQDVIVQLDATGNGSITTGDVDDGSNDACGISSLSLDNLNFDCNDLLATPTNSNDLFISEYIEGTGNNKCIEIFNNTGAAINLGSNNYNILIYFNGSTSAGSNINLTGTINPGDVYVVCNSSATSAFTNEADQTTGSMSYNGCDAVVLRKSSTILDVFGKIGQDPGTQWSVLGNNTRDQTLVRNANITEGNTDDLLDFPSLGTEWTEFGQNTSSNLGSHTISGSVSTPTVTLTVTDNNGNISTCTAEVTVEDNIAPVASCQDVTIQLDASGNASITTADIDDGSNDACGIESLSLNDQDFTCANINDNTVILTVTDNNGNVSTCTATVTVVDNLAPVALCQDAVVQLDAAGTGSIGTVDIDDGSNDACGVASLSLDNTAFDCSNVGDNTVTLTVTDNNGNVAACSATVTVEDNVDPVASCHDITVQLDAAGTGSIGTGDINDGSSDACGIASLAIDDNAFDCLDISAPVSITELFISEYIEGSSFNKAVEIYNGTGAAVDLSAGDYELEFYFNGNSSPATTIDLSGSAADGDVYVVADNDADGSILAQTDQTSNSSFFNGCDAVVLTKGGVAIDIFGAIGHDPGIQWSVNGNNTQNQTLVRNANVSAGNTDNITGFPSLGTEWTEFPSNDASNLGSHTVGSGGVVVTLTVTDNNGNVSTCTSTVTVEDNVDPNAICQDVTVQLDATGNTSITTGDIDNGSNDACGIESLVLDQTTFNCSNVGDNTVSLMVTDNNGNISTCSAIVTVEDNVDPVATCTDITVQLNAAGIASIGTGDIDNGSTDACGNASLNLDITSFDCSNVGDNTVTLTVADNNGNISTCTATVTVEDNVNPTAICQSATIQLDAVGNASITTGDIDNGSNDACGIASLSLDNTAFNCTNVGGNAVTLTVTDNNGNVSSCNATVIVEDNVAPVATCQDATVQLDAGGNGSITAVDIDNGSNDACGIATLALDNTGFDCTNVGDNTVTLTVTDNNGNLSTCSATVTVEDNIDPVALCQNLTVQLDANGVGNISATGVDNGSSDACGVASLSLDQTAFDCTNVGENTVTLTITDNNNNSSTCTADITVEDNVAPEAICQDITLELDVNGNTGVTASEINNGSTDACQIESVSLDKIDFSCSDVGANSVELTVTDYNGNTSTCTATVVVEDNIAPVAECQGLTIQLDATGNASIGTGDIDNGSNDACGVASLSLDQTAFDCSHVGSNTVTLTVTDNNSNTSTCTASVEVEDNVAPVATCQDVTVQLGVNGSGSITPQDIDNGSSDACGIATLSLNNTSFDCTNVGVNNTVTLTVTDNSGNASTCSATVTVEDNVAPTALCQDLVIQLSATGNASITTGDIDNGSNDACGIANLSLDNTTFDCTNAGGNVVTLTVTDNNGNVSTCSSTITVQDNIDPIAICEDVTVTLDALGNASITTSDIDNGSNDACGIDHLVLSQSVLTYADYPSTTVTLTVTDNNGNTATCNSEVTVNIICNNLTNGGEIGSLEIGCGPFDPAPITSVVDPSGGGNAPIEYLWLSTNDPAAPFNTWTVIAQSTESTYDPGMITKTTYYLRCSRRLGCTTYRAESNLVAKIVNGFGNQCDADEVATEITGNADTWIKNHGVSYASNALGEIDGQGAQFYHYHDYIVLDLGEIVKAGEQYTITWKKRNYQTYTRARMLIYESINDYGWGNYQYNKGVFTSSKYKWVHTTITAKTDTRYIKLRNYKGYSDFEVDAVTYCNIACGNLPPDGYCSSEGITTAYEWINRVKLNTIDNTSGDDGGYANYDNLSTDLSKGSNYNITLTPGFSGNSYREYWKVWIDWNQDGDFNDSHETVYWGNGYGTKNGTIQVPSNALNGETRMRVSMKNQYNSYPTSCEEFWDGEVEDYTINVVANYCQSSASSTHYEYINHVSMGSINNVSGNNSGYGNFTDQSTIVNQGSTYTLNLAPGFNGWSYREYWTVWIDWNGDKDFEDAGEKVAQTNGYGVKSVNITVPAGASLGDARMRIQMQYYLYSNNSCSNFRYGEVEDYTLKINGSASRVSTGITSDVQVRKENGLDYDIKLYPNPTSDYLKVDIPTNSEVKTEIAIVDITGTVLYDFKFGKVEEVNEIIDVRQWPAGTYFMTVVNGERMRSQPFTKVK